MIPAYAPYHPAANPEAVVRSLTSEADRNAHNEFPAGGPGGKNTGPGNDPKKTTAALENFSMRRVSHGTVLLTLNQLAVMNQNGIDIAEAIETVAFHCRNKRLARSLHQIHEAVNNGQAFSTAVASFGTHFPPTLAPMLAAAEATGQVPQTLGNVCERLRSELQLRGTILARHDLPDYLDRRIIGRDVRFDPGSATAIQQSVLVPGPTNPRVHTNVVGTGRFLS